MARTSRWVRAIFFAAATATAACSDETVIGSDSGAPRSDATNDPSGTDGGPDDAASDTAASDSPVDLAALDVASDAPSEKVADGDDACTCTLVDSGSSAPPPANGVMSSLACYCAMPWAGLPGATPCASYEVATRCDSARTDFSVETYTNCNLVTVRYGGVFTIDARVYDHSTHELVGAYRGTDYSLPCGASQALLISFGVLPGPECQTAKIESPCDDAKPATSSS